MDDALLVGLLERLGDLQADLDGVLAGGGVPAESTSPERPPFDVLHDDAASVADLEKLVDAADVGMVEGCGQLRFAKQPPPGGRVLAGMLSARTLMATLRPSDVSSARNTSPMPPWPSFAVTR